MSVYSLDTIDPLYVRDFSGFTLPDDVSVVNILGDGTSAFNGVLQSPGTSLPQAQLSGWCFTAPEMAALRALRLSEDPVLFMEPEGPHTVVVTQLVVVNKAGLPWEWSVVLIELPTEGS